MESHSIYLEIDLLYFGAWVCKLGFDRVARMAKRLTYSRNVFHTESLHATCQGFLVNLGTVDCGASPRRWICHESLNKKLTTFTGVEHSLSSSLKLP